MNPTTIEAAIALLAKVVTAAPSVIDAAKTLGPAVVTAARVFTHQIDGQAALDDIAAKEADIDAHIAHIDAEGVKLDAMAASAEDGA